MRTPVITGIGVVSSIGLGLREFWDSLAEGRCGIGDVTLFDTSGYRGQPGAQVRDIEPDDAISHAPACGVHFRKNRLSRCDVLGLLAACEALTDAGYSRCDIPPERVSVVMGAGGGGLLSGEAFRRQIFNKQHARPSLLVPFTAGAFTNAVAWLAGSKGVLSTISTACSSSATAIGIAGELIRSGRADVVITGGSEGLSETTFSGFNSLRAVDEVPCRPFDLNRKGISLGEGAAVFVVEALEERICESRPYAEIGGYGLSADAYHATAPAPDGLCVARAIKDALSDAGVLPDDIGYINAHGTGTKVNDSAETNAIKAVFGQRAYDIPASSTKSMLGHCLGAAGALEAAASILPFIRGVVPPTVHYETPDPECDLDYVPNKGREVKGINAVLSNSLAFGGNNTALVLKRI